ncbi:MAG: hypothetical protein ACTSRP_11530, partial [Candidatus Helarchaeota archaeon]
MKLSLKILTIFSIILPIVHIIFSTILRNFGYDFYGNILSLLKLFLIPLGITYLLWYLLSPYVAKYFIVFLHYIIYRNRKRPKSIYFFTENEYPTSISNYLREALYPTALYLSIVIFILNSGVELVNEIFSISVDIFNLYFYAIVLIFPVLSTFLIVPIKLIDWCGFRYYNSKRNAIFQVGLKVGT